MIRLGKDVRLNICPILVTLHHDYVFEGPCRMGKDFERTKGFDDMTNAELVRGAREEIAENLTSPHFCVMEPIWIDRNEEVPRHPGNPGRLSVQMMRQICHTISMCEAGRT